MEVCSLTKHNKNLRPIVLSTQTLGARYVLRDGLHTQACYMYFLDELERERERGVLHCVLGDLDISLLDMGSAGLV